MAPGKKLQCVFAKGLFTKWKTPVYFAVDENMSSPTLLKIVSAVEKAGFLVRGVSFDLGNKKFLSDVGFTAHQNHFFVNPEDESRKVYLVPDPPHLLKTLRNHLFEKGKIQNYTIDQILS